MSPSKRNRLPWIREAPQLRDDAHRPVLDEQDVAINLCVNWGVIYGPISVRRVFDTKRGPAGYYNLTLNEQELHVLQKATIVFEK
jgi:hypothetical protein